MAYSNDVQIQGKAYSLSERPVKNDDGIMAEGLGGDRTKVFSGHDRRDMRRMGKKQEFRRNFRIISTIGFTTCIMGTWEILLTANTQGLIAGGLLAYFGLYVGVIPGNYSLSCRWPRWRQSLRLLEASTIGSLSLHRGPLNAS